jgi:peptidoglycan hydrolase CwlO-like protein
MTALKAVFISLLYWILDKIDEDRKRIFAEYDAERAEVEAAHQSAQKQLEQTNAKRVEIENEIAEAKKEIEHLRGELSGLDSQLAGLHNEADEKFDKLHSTDGDDVLHGDL